MKWIAKEKTPMLDALAMMAPDCSKTTLRSWLKEKRVLVDGEIAPANLEVIEAGQTISLAQKVRYLPEQIQLLYHDKYIIVIDKPETILSVSTDFEKKMTAHSILKNEFRPAKVHVVHRLDQDTSGVMLFALSEEAQQGLKNDFEKHNIERCYNAIVEGHLSESEGTWRSYLYEDKNYVVHSTQDKAKGSLAVSHYKVLGQTRKYTWLEVQLETGKKNQIRVHCMDAGHPVAGDKKYGAATDPIKRLCLHACYLAFRHPITKKMMSFKSPLPESFHKIIKPSFSKPKG